MNRFSPLSRGLWCFALVVLVVLFLPVTVAGQARGIRSHVSTQLLDQYAQWLRLDSSQRDIATAMHEEYEHVWATTLLEEVRAYNKRVTDVAQKTWAVDTGQGDLSRKLYPPLDKEYDELIIRVDELDEHFFNSLSALLRVDQVEYMARVRWGDLRLRHLSSAQHQLPEGNVDLISLVDSLHLPPELYDAIEEEFIFSFEPSYVAQLRKMDEAVRAFYVRYWDVFDLQDRVPRADQYDDNAVDLPALYAKIADAKKRTARPVIAAYTQMVTLNRSGLARLLELLPADRTDELHRRYLEVAYPQVYPDPTTAHALYDAVEAIEGLTDEQRQQISLVREGFTPRHEAASRKMAEAVYDRYWSLYAGRPGRRGNVEELWVVLRDLGYEREALNARQVSMIRPVLTPEQAARLPDWDFAKNPPRRRWDREYERQWRRRDRQQRIERMRQEAQRKDDGDGESDPLNR